jgi:hypothetical protein
MAQISSSSPARLSRENRIWQNLKYAISASSGFQSWQLECNTQL